MTEGQPWITDPAEREAFERDMKEALAADLAAMPKPKRQVSYNQDAVLCPACKKRIRLNNNGRLRVHVAGKVGSDKCTGSNAEPLSALVTFADVENQIAEVANQAGDPVVKRITDKLYGEPESNLFSDPA